MLRATLGHKMIRSFFNRENKGDGAVSSCQGQPDSQFDEAELIREKFGLRDFDVSVSPISKGLSNISLMRFSGPQGPFMIRKTVEKDMECEISFMRGLLDSGGELSQFFRLNWPLPEVYAVKERKDAYDIYMQDVKGIAFRGRSEAAPLARPLAKAIHELTLTLPAVCQKSGVSLKERGSPGRSFFAKAEWQIDDDVEKLKEISRLQRELPSQISHNDIFWPNFGVMQASDNFHFKFIDFGMIGLNYPGADLHHFARVSVRSKHHDEFFRRLSRYYASQARLNISLIQMNAFYYAAMRLIAFETKNKDGTSPESSGKAAALLKGAISKYDKLCKV